MAGIDDSIRAAALRLLNKGQLTIAEVARVAGLSRQLVRYWAQEAGINTTRANQQKLKQQHIKKIWQKELSRLILFREEPTVLTVEARDLTQARRTIQQQLNKLGEGGYVVKTERVDNA